MPKAAPTFALLLAGCGSPALPPADAAADAAAPPDAALSPDAAASPDAAVTPDGSACAFATQAGEPVLVACATTVVLVNEGGGFRPPPPAGSDCHGERRYTLALSSGQLDWTI